MAAGVLMQRRNRRSGFTLVEVMIAVVILGIATVSLMSATARMIRGVTDDRSTTQAAASAEARIAMIRQWPTYASIESTFVATESNLPLPGWTRTTAVVRTGGPTASNDFKRVTVTITGPSLRAPVSRTITIAAP